NSFGIYREYPCLPSHDPDKNLSLADQSTIPAAPVASLAGTSATDARLSPLSQSSPSSKASFDVGRFRNTTIFGFMNWMWSGSIMKSIADCTKLLDFLKSDDFVKEDLIGFDLKAETARWDKELAGNVLGNALGTASGIKDGWKEVSVDIQVSDGANCGPDNPLPVFSVPGLHFRNATQAIKSALEDRSSRFFHYAPFKQFWQRTPDEEPQHSYNEIYSSTAFIEAHEKIQRKPAEPNCTLEHVVAALMWWSNSTHLANFGMASLWPLYLWFRNQLKWVCGKPRAGACHHIAYMPKV
ncbi:hypothetical protein B0H17DRAFT_899062, partial [Mycena rosella]